jgi:hypothetical protein
MSMVEPLATLEPSVSITVAPEIVTDETGITTPPTVTANSAVEALVTPKASLIVSVT